MKSPIKPKRTDFSLHSIQTADGEAEVRKNFRRLFGDSWYPQTPGPPTITKWFCFISDCKMWRDTDGSYIGECRGYCVYG